MTDVPAVHMPGTHFIWTAGLPMKMSILRSIADKAVRILRENHICERFDYIFEERENRHLHVWILPRYDWMAECTDDIIADLGAVFDYALCNFKNEEKYREIERVTGIVKNGFGSSI